MNNAKRCETFKKPDREPDIKVKNFAVWVDEKLMTCHQSQHAYKELYIGGLNDKDKLNVDEMIAYLLDPPTREGKIAFAEHKKAIHDYLIEQELLGETDSND